MQVLLMTGAALAFGTGIAHSYLGERYILIRLFRRADLPQLFGSDWFTRRTLRFAWHLTSVAWWGFGALMIVIADPSRTPSRGSLSAVVAATFLVTSAITLFASRGRHLAWPVFLAVALAAWFGSR